MHSSEAQGTPDAPHLARIGGFDMKSLVWCDSIAQCFAPAALVLLIGACGGEKQVQAKAPAAPHPAPAGRTNVQPPTVPNTPTAANIVIAPEILRACNIPDADAYFAFDSSKLTSFDLSPLDALATCFTSGPMKGRSLHLVGHADPRGVSEYNVTLGQARADSVSGYLVDHGLSRNQVTTTSRGAMDATGRDETGWAHDRRVDVYLAR
jgi:peptidoglycan-associated lipoprotein